MTVSEYGNHWRIDDPTEICEEDDMTPEENCGDEVNTHFVHESFNRVPLQTICALMDDLFLIISWRSLNLYRRFAVISSPVKCSASAAA